MGNSNAVYAYEETATVKLKMTSKTSGEAKGLTFRSFDGKINLS